jgi:hypothetical protein
MPEPEWLYWTLLIVLDGTPVAVLMIETTAHARRAGVPADWHQGFALFGGFAAAIGAQLVTNEFLFRRDLRLRPVPVGLGAAMVVVSGLLAGSAVAAGCYLHLRMRTARDPDYEDPAGPERPSLEADFPQPRDGDHVGPD